MSERPITRLLSRAFDLVALVVAGASAVYVFVHLYRWEWQRAIVSGIFLLVAEVALLGMWILRRLSRLEERLEETARPRRRLPTRTREPRRAEAIEQRIAATRPTERRHFDWLDPNRTSVFVPVLLGTGIVLSVLAWVVERVAGLGAVPAMERSLTARLAALAPEAPLVTATPAAPVRVVPPAASSRQIVGRLSLAVAVVAGAWLGIGALGDATQDRPGELADGEATVVDLTIDHRDGRPTSDAAASLWGACRHTVDEEVALVSLAYPSESAVRMAISPAVGEHEVRKLRGCLADSGIPRMLVSVGTVTRVEIDD